jgi:diacylglycerol kinase
LKDFIKSRAHSFRYAVSGWRYVLHTQHNAWIHASVSLLVVAVSLWLRLSPRDWAVVLLAITMVWTAEFLNTALEAVVDLASQYEQQELARVGKDVGAAAVLIAAVASALIGLLILGPPLWGRIQPLFNP